MPEYVQVDRPISVTTPLGKDALLLVGLTGQEAISQLFHFELDLLAENTTEVAFDKLLGQKVTVDLRLSEREQRYFHGIVSRVSQGARDQDFTFTRYRAEVVPQFWLLTKKVQSRIFQHVSVPDILKKVLEGLDVAYEIQGTFQPRDYCVQYRESDFNFASRLMEEEGIYYFFKHSAGGHKMVLANTPQSHPELSPSGIIYEELSGGLRDERRVLSWEKAQELRSGKYTLWDHCFELPHKHLEAEKAIADAVKAGNVTHKLKVGGNDKLEIYDYPGAYAGRFDGVDRGGGDKPADIQKIFEDNKRTVEIRMQSEAAPGIVIQGVGNCGHFVPGFRFTLERHFNADGVYVLTSVQHSARLTGEYRRGPGRTQIEYENTFTCIPAALPYRPLRVTPLPRVHGTQTAVVVGPAGEEIFTDKYSRVKVQFHWDRQGKNDGDSSCWVRVATLWAGKQWGVIHIPRIGQEVIVDFLEGDPNEPIIVGSVYNAEQMPPYGLPGNKTQSGIKSRSSLGGGGADFNEFRFEDKMGKEQIFLHAQKDQDIEVENDETHWVGHDRTKTIDHDETIAVKNNRKTTITVNEDLTVERGNQTTKVSLGKSESEALQSIELKVGQSSVKLDQTGVTIKGMMIKIEGQVLVQMKGLTTQVNGDAMLTLKGGITMIN